MKSTAEVFLAEYEIKRLLKAGSGKVLDSIIKTDKECSQTNINFIDVDDTRSLTAEQEELLIGLMTEQFLGSGKTAQFEKGCRKILTEILVGTEA